MTKAKKTTLALKSGSKIGCGVDDEGNVWDKSEWSKSELTVDSNKEEEAEAEETELGEVEPVSEEIWLPQNHLRIHG